MFSKKKPLLDLTKDGEDSMLSETRYGVMTIAGFIPLFNWMVWVFAYLDTQERKYVVFSLIYLAPYLNSSLSLSPSDSWLPLVSTIACGIHVQLDKFAEDSEPLFPELKTSLQKNLNFEAVSKKLQEALPRSDERRKAKDALKEDSSRILLDIWDEKFSESGKVSDSKTLSNEDKQKEASRKAELDEWK